MTAVATPAENALRERLLAELEPVVASNLDRHLSLAKEWHPHDYVPWSRARDFAFLGGEDWRPEESALDQVAQIAMITNLMTEDNLPSYHREIATRFGRDGAWGQWVGRWTAEEGRHAIAIRDYLVVTRGVDPVALERSRMASISAGYDSGDKTMLQALAYVSFQELATRVSHRNTGRITGDPLAEQLLARISVDENLHMVFYRNLMAAAFEISPDDAMCAVRDEIVSFAIMAKAGIYDLQLHHDDVVLPVLKFWRALDRTDVGPRGEQARDELAVSVADLAQRAAKFVAQRERSRERAAARA
jgi:acyl-[acyl-carrier-protein] desaturase